MHPPVTAGVDGSAASLAAAVWAAEEAALRRTRLHLVAALGAAPDVRTPVAERAERTSVAGPADRRQWARRSLRLAEDRVRTRRPRLEITSEIVSAAPMDALLDAGGDAQLLALGSYGLGNVSARTLGSTGPALAVRAPFPVALVRQAYQAPRRAPVLLGLDARRPADELIGQAFEEAAVREVPLQVVHAWQPPGPAQVYPANLRPPRAEQRLARRAAKRLPEVLVPWREKWPEVRVIEDFTEENAARAVACRSSMACLVVLGVRALLGPVTHSTLQQAHCPVLLVPHT
ncbi:universal stress protein [Streptomyces sp. NPDC051940]|uniref:universal stress protein n=1 Tax=Streptomyces sp. NPDC051940 TaxID=3155675 RepID=UPI0034244367